MTLKAIEAIAAYTNAADTGKLPGAAATGGGSKTNFADFVKDAAEATVDNLRKGEEMTLKSVTGEAELVDIVTAVTNAELTLQTVVAVRDRVVQAYQDIIKMPI